MKQKIGNRMNTIKYSLISLTLFVLSSMSQAEVTASVDRNQIVIGETFTLTVSVDKNTNEQPDLSELEQVFRVLGTSQSSSTQIINGSYSVNKSWQISLMPLGVGENTIPPIKLGTEYTKPIQIKITKSDPNAKANGDIFIEVVSDKDSAFVKEQILVTIKLFYSISLSEGVLSEPVASNAIISQLGKGSSYRTQRDGKLYEVIERHYALFAEKSGVLELNPVIFNGRDNTSRRNFSMFSTGKPVRAVSKPLSFEIKPIPQTSIGKAWLPASKVQISQQWSKPPYKVGEPITRTITLYVEGLGETQIPDIELGDIPDIRIYPEQPQTQTEETTETLKSYKQVKLALIPTHDGAIRIPEYQLEWYNVKTNTIEYAKLPPMTLQVDAGEFAMEKPKIDNPFVSKKQGDTVQKPETPNNIDNTSVTIIEKDPTLWQILSALLLVLWLITLFLFLKKPASKTQKKKTKTINISKKQILMAAEQSNLKELQTVLLSWWNDQYPNHKVTNLSQIKNLVNPQMQNLLEELQQQLYCNEADNKHSFNRSQWLKQIKGKGLKLADNKPESKGKNSNDTSLPALY